MSVLIARKLKEVRAHGPGRLAVYWELRFSRHTGRCRIVPRFIPLGRNWSARAWERKPHLVERGDV